MARFIVGITGASGSIYGARLTEELLKQKDEVYLIITDNGRRVLEFELDINFQSWLDRLNRLYGGLNLCDIKDMFSSVASGSFRTEGMVIAPCSMGSLAKISNGVTDNLLIRAADVIIKEKRKLILVPRETPFSSIHLRNMLVLSDLGATILPPMPAFYNKPKAIDEIVDNTVGRVLTSLRVDNTLYKEWDGVG
ncbi:UbiX family flavin prenyltransferase [Wukongibacter sp. M2B1]|uniref:UbiX family flavin prenyltransferase n=1 Tax=Wukongibacter sp. M2B1 TaxID=3088895 RepID=UPI003D793F9E